MLSCSIVTLRSIKDKYNGKSRGATKNQVTQPLYLFLDIHMVQLLYSHAVDPARENRPLEQLEHALEPSKLYVFAGQ